MNFKIFVREKNCTSPLQFIFTDLPRHQCLSVYTKFGMGSPHKVLMQSSQTVFHFTKILCFPDIAKTQNQNMYLYGYPIEWKTLRPNFL